MAVSDTFKVVATPSQELLLELSNLAAKGNDAINHAHKKPTESETKKEDDRNDIALNVLQQISEQERVYQEYRKQSQQINNAIELALGEASTPEERQEILDYQNFVDQIDEDIEQKREDGVLEKDDIEHAQISKLRAIPESVHTQYDKLSASNPSITASELVELDNLSTSSFAASTENKSFGELSEINKSFQSAVLNESVDGQTPTEPNITPTTPSDLSKFTM